MLQPNFRKVAFIFDRSISIAFKSGLYGGRYVPRGCNWGAPYFNSRPSARGDWDTGSAFNGGSVFQFTPLREGRRRCLPDAPESAYFNSRPSARGDAARPVSPASRTHFNSRPSARGDYGERSDTDATRNFNSRPSARGDSKRYAISANLLSNPHKLPRFSSRAM